MVVIDEFSVVSAFNEGVVGNGGSVSSSASRVVVAGLSLWARGSEPEAVVPLATAPPARQDASNR